MKTLYRNRNYTPCHPEALAEGSCHTTEIPFKILRDKPLRMTVCLSSSCMTAVVLTCLLLSLPTQAKWGDNCTLNGGTIIKANEYGNDKGGKCNDPNNADLTNNCNGMEFCVSNKTMNWWSAFTWCDSIGGKLASFEHLCPGTPARPNNVAKACPNVTGISERGSTWTSTGWGTNFALNVALGLGHVVDGYRRNTTNYHIPICEEK